MNAQRKLIEIEQQGRKLALYGKSQGDLEFFVEGIHGMAFSGTHAKLNLFTTVPFVGEQNEEHREVVARLVIPTGALVAMAQFLSQRVDELIKAGKIKIAEERPGQPREEEGGNSTS